MRMNAATGPRTDIPNLSVKHLKAIVALARHGSFIAAATYLGISQPGLSRMIKQAEGLLGVALFARATRSVSQTDAGREFTPVAERLLGELSEQSRKLKVLDGQLRGQLIIASLMSISHHVLPAALVELRRRHPKVHIKIREGLGSAVQDDVRSGVADLGIGNVFGSDGDIAAEAVAREPCYVVLPRHHPMARAPSLSLRDLAAEPLISMPTDSGLRRTIDVHAGERGLALNHSIETNQFGSLFDFVASGLGVSIVPAAALPRADKQPIVVRRLRPAITRRIGILRLAGRPLSPVPSAFLEIFRPRFFAAIRQHGAPPRLAPRAR